MKAQGPSDEELIARAQAGGPGAIEARNALIVRHMGFIVMVIRRSVPHHRNHEELIGLAVEAYIRSIELYDPKFGTKLNTYAGNAIYRLLARAWLRDSLVRRPLQRAETRRDEYQRVFGQLRSLVDVAAPEPKEAAAWSHREIMAAMDRLLDERARRILLARTIGGQGLREVAAVEGISRERVRRIEARAKRVVREALEAMV